MRRADPPSKESHQTSKNRFISFRSQILNRNRPEGLIQIYCIINICITKYYIKQSSWKANSHSSSQEIPNFLWNPKAHYRVHKSTQFVPIWARWIHSTPSSPCFRKIHSNIILPSSPLSSTLTLSLQILRPNSFVHISHLSHACYMLRPSHRPWFDHPNNIWWSVQIMKLLTM
jgi:hypothetical protein